MHNDLMPEEALEITEENIESIIDEYDVDRSILSAAVGMMFVGEIGCEYWYGFLTVETFQHRYEFTEQLGRVGVIVARKEVSPTRRA